MAKGKIVIDKVMCKGCGLCVKACPAGVIKISEQGQTNKQGYRYMEAAHPLACTGCGMCRLMCPDSAITVWRAATKPEG
jgi:2-oxoglutarate ferredoxin oxidoreductase subunit delta